MEKVKYFLALVGGICAGYFEQHGRLFFLVGVAVLMDLFSGVAASLIEGRGLSSRTAIKGVARKLLSLFAVAFGTFLDVLLPWSAALAGIDITMNLHFSAVISAYICITESISVLENLYRATGQKMPRGIANILEIAKEKIEHSGE